MLYFELKSNFVQMLWIYYLSNDSSHDLCYDLSHDLSNFFSNTPNPKKSRLMSDGSWVSYKDDSFELLNVNKVIDGS